MIHVLCAMVRMTQRLKQLHILPADQLQRPSIRRKTGILLSILPVGMTSARHTLLHGKSTVVRVPILVYCTSHSNHVVMHDCRVGFGDDPGDYNSVAILWGFVAQNHETTCDH